MRPRNPSLHKQEFARARVLPCPGAVRRSIERAHHHSRNRTQRAHELLLQIQQWRQDKQPQRPPPKIEIQEKEWSVTPRTKTGRHLPKKRPLQCETAKIWQESVGEMGLLHDLTHSGMTHALQMLDEERNIGPNYSAMNQTLLLCFADKAVMFAIMMWPGAGQKYWREIEQAGREHLPAKEYLGTTYWNPYRLTARNDESHHQRTRGRTMSDATIELVYPTQ